MQITKKRFDELDSYPITETEILIDKKKDSISKIIYDDDNGIKSLLGEMRIDIRLDLLKTILLFAEVHQLFINQFNNYLLMGGPGTGKTKIAGILGNFFYNLGILLTDKVFTTSRSDLVGIHIGTTAILTRQVLDSSLEGILFVDEAYQLPGCSGNAKNSSFDTFGLESIAEIVNYIDKHIGLIIIIVAGYEKK